MPRRPITVSYIIFYLLFLPDSWQALMGLVAAYIITPMIVPSNGGPAQAVLLFVMIATIIYAATRLPAKGLTRVLKKWILGDKIS